MPDGTGRTDAAVLDDFRIVAPGRGAARVPRRRRRSRPTHGRPARAAARRRPRVRDGAIGGHRSGRPRRSRSPGPLDGVPRARQPGRPPPRREPDPDRPPAGPLRRMRLWGATFMTLAAYGAWTTDRHQAVASSWVLDDNEWAPVPRAAPVLVPIFAAELALFAVSPPGSRRRCAADPPRAQPAPPHLAGPGRTARVAGRALSTSPTWPRG